MSIDGIKEKLFIISASVQLLTVASTKKDFVMCWAPNVQDIKNKERKEKKRDK